jgi:excisionase family DNA binding protein
MLKLPETTIRAMTADGRICSVKLGQSVRFRRQDVEALIRAAAGEPEPEEAQETTVPLSRFVVAAGEERVEVSADAFEVTSGGTLVLRDPDENLVAIFAPEHWQWINRA